MSQQDDFFGTAAGDYSKRKGKEVEAWLESQGKASGSSRIRSEIEVDALFASYAKRRASEIHAALPHLRSQQAKVLERLETRKESASGALRRFADWLAQVLRPNAVSPVFKFATAVAAILVLGLILLESHSQKGRKLELAAFPPATHQDGQPMVAHSEQTVPSSDVPPTVTVRPATSGVSSPGLEMGLVSSLPPEPPHAVTPSFVSSGERPSATVPKGPALASPPTLGRTQSGTGTNELALRSVTPGAENSTSDSPITSPPVRPSAAKPVSGDPPASNQEKPAVHAPALAASPGSEELHPEEQAHPSTANVERSISSFLPVCRTDRTSDGSTHFKLLDPIGVFLPEGSAVAQTVTPVLALWSVDRNPEQGSVRRALLWQVYRQASSPEGKAQSLLFGLFKRTVAADGQVGIRLFGIPVAGHG
jgi:hypothetical protein